MGDFHITQKNNTQKMNTTYTLMSQIKGMIHLNKEEIRKGKLGEGSNSIRIYLPSLVGSTQKNLDYKNHHLISEGGF